MLTPHGHTFSIKARGQRWSGTWALDGKDVVVSSAFGSASAPKVRKAPEAVAAAVLEQLVANWCERRAG